MSRKYGVRAGLLGCKSLQEQFSLISNQVGSFYAQWENFRLTPEGKKKSTEKLKSDPHEFSGHTVGEVRRQDGLKLVFGDGFWLCFRLSGTVPVVPGQEPDF